MKKIVVVGSLNMDIVMEVNRMPKMGETIKGDQMSYLIGGKGSNQAVAACRLGNEVSIIGCTGNDTFGDKIKKHLKEEGINTDSLKVDDVAFTGVATIFKTKEDNSIVVIPGANDFCDKELIDKHKEIIKSADILITQFEIPAETVKYALEIAKENGVKTILNPAPAREISSDILKNVDIITPNETEFEIISGKSYEDNESFEKAMIDWEKEHGTKLVVTRGKDGSSYIEDNKVITKKTIKVEAVDTTGAGDTFNGALAHAISHGYSMDEAVKFAGTAASISVTKFGAQTGMPTMEIVDKFLSEVKGE